MVCTDVELFCKQHLIRNPFNGLDMFAGLWLCTIGGYELCKLVVIFCSSSLVFMGLEILQAYQFCVLWVDIYICSSLFYILTPW